MDNTDTPKTRDVDTKGPQKLTLEILKAMTIIAYPASQRFKVTQVEKCVCCDN